MPATLVSTKGLEKWTAAVTGEMYSENKSAAGTLGSWKILSDVPDNLGQGQILLLDRLGLSWHLLDMSNVNLIKARAIHVGVLSKGFQHDI